ncbi:hypothetical protein GCM10027191_15660 [Novilysobacter erysipheiresistens]
MHACGKALAFALLGTAVAFPIAAKSASLHIGITIVEACDVRTREFASSHPGDPVEAKCSSDTPYSVAVESHPAHGDGRPLPAIVPDDGSAVAPPGYRIATFTL